MKYQTSSDLLSMLCYKSESRFSPFLVEEQQKESAKWAKKRNEELEDWERICDQVPKDDAADRRCAIDKYYEITKDAAWDLWSAAMNPIKNMKLESAPKLPTHGPLFNQIAQSDNFAIGLMLAYTTHLFGTTLSTFADYDT